jgi:hypothetical protein
MPGKRGSSLHTNRAPNYSRDDTRNYSRRGENGTVMVKFSLRCAHCCAGACPEAGDLGHRSPSFWRGERSGVASASRAVWARDDAAPYRLRRTQ